MSLVPKLVQVTVPEGVSPGDTINVEAEGQTVQCQVPADMKPGDTFQVQTATQPVVPPHAVRVWVSLIVTKLYSLLMKIGEHRAKEVDDHHNYDAKCACMP